MIIRLLIALLVFLVGLEIGTALARRSRVVSSDHRSPLQRVTDFWLAGTDGRVNYSRATALVGLVMFCIVCGFGLYVFQRSKPPLTEILYALLLACGGMLGINLGQFGITKVSEVKMTQATNPQPPAAPPPPVLPATQVNVTAGAPAAAERRDSGVGATALRPAVQPPEGS